MKNQQFIGSKKFWMALAAIFGTFILFTGILLVCLNPFAPKTTYVVNTTPTANQQEAADVDHSFDAVKQRVDSINDNYGQGVKSAYYGGNSTVEQMMKNRMFFNNLKSTLMIILVLLVILLVLVKGFNIRFFKKAFSGGDAGETDQTVEEPIQKAAPKKATTKPEAVQQTQKAAPTEEKKSGEAVAEEQVTEEQAAEERDKDVQEVTDSCQLP